MLITLKFRFPEIVLGILLAVAIFATGMVVDSSRRQEQSVQKQKTEQSTAHIAAKNDAEETIAFYTKALAWFTAVLAVSTIGLWAVTWLAGRRQSRDMQASIKLARDEFNSSHRPKIRLKHAWFADNKLGWRVGGPLEITLDFVNIGDGPALITWVVYQSVILKSDERLPQRPPFIEPVPH